VVERPFTDETTAPVELTPAAAATECGMEVFDRLVQLGTAPRVSAIVVAAAFARVTKVGRCHVYPQKIDEPK
jgi:hypothetical protein